MSIKLLSAAWDLDIESTEKMVLMCLCNHANEEGVCWPSVATIGRKCSKSERTVQSALKWLNDNGYFKFKDTPGKGRLYSLNPRKICTPANSALVQSTTDTPANLAPHPRKSRTLISNEPSVTVKVLPPTPKRPAKVLAAMAVDVPDWVPAQQWDDFIAMRIEKGKAPTGRAIALLVGKLDKMRRSGQDPGAVLDKSTMNNWTDIYPIKDQPNGNQPPRNNNRSSDEPLNPFVRAAAERQAERAAHGEGQSGGWPDHSDGFEGMAGGAPD